MKLNLKPTVVYVLLMVAVAVPAYLLKVNANTEKTVKIVDYEFSVCTQDIPTSGCGSYNVTAQTADGRKATYKVAGFSNRDSKRYDEITSKITGAKEQKTQVTLKVNNKSEIVSVK